MSIQIKNIYKHFKHFTALNNVSLDIHSGELIALLGPSGSGKTTLLRIIAGLEYASSGSVLFDGEDTTAKSLKERNVGFVFQHYALFKHMTVFENVAFGLKVRPKKLRPSPEAIHQKVMSLLKLVHIDQLQDRYPAQLSGGQRQRVALARSLAVEPKILLLDEPFGALDAKVRKELRRWMRRLHDEIHITSIFVTHDQEEAMEVADRVVVMNQGRIEQAGTPAQVYNEPSNAFVYDFLGNFNVFEGWKDEHGVAHITEYEVMPGAGSVHHEPHTRQGAGAWLARQPVISSVLHTLPFLHKKPVAYEGGAPLVFAPDESVGRKGKPIKIFARPHDMEVAKAHEEKEYIPAKVVHINPAGALVKLELERKNGTIIQAEISKELFVQLNLRKNDQVFVRPRETRVFE